MASVAAAAAATEAFCSFLRSCADGASGVGVLDAAIRAGGLGPTLELLFARIVAHVVLEGQDEEGEASAAEAEAGDDGAGGVYVDSADAFEIFVSTGGNVAMYEAVDRTLSAAWRGAVAAEG